jgi:hypothetical protein
MSPSFRRMWGAPICLGILTAIGLLAALLGDGMWDALSALALGIPAAATIWYGCRKR